MLFLCSYTDPIWPSSGSTPVEVAYPNTNTSAFQYTGKWSVNTAGDVPSPTSTAPYHITSQYGSAVSMNFTGGEAIAVYGFRDWGNWIYNVVSTIPHSRQVILAHWHGIVIGWFHYPVQWEHTLEAGKLALILPSRARSQSNTYPCSDR